MSQPSPLFRHAWMPVLLLAAGFVVAVDLRRVTRVEAITAAVTPDVVPAPASPTGYAGGLRALIMPEQNSDSAAWIVQTQQMFATGNWRVRHIDYENAPYGRDLVSPSPYRWWLAGVAELNQFLTGKSAGLAVESAALYADAALHLLLLLFATVFTARLLGSIAGCVTAVAIASLFPFAANYLPGAPDDQGLALAAVLASLLPLTVALTAIPGPNPAATARKLLLWFFCTGVMGGLGLWVSVTYQAPMVAGVAFGGLLAALLRCNEPSAPALPWLAWSLGGGASSLLAYLVEFYPAHLGNWQLRAVHPLYSLAWVGLGVLLATLTPWLQRQPARWNAARFGALVFALLAIAALPVAIARTGPAGFLAREVSTYRLTRLSDAAEAKTFWAWLAHDGVTAVAWTTLSPMLLILPAAWLLREKRLTSGERSALAVALGPVAVALLFAGWQLSWWSVFDVALLVLVLGATAPIESESVSGKWRWAWRFALLVAILPGLPRLLPPSGKGELEGAEFAGLLERDLAHWLSKRVGPGHKAIILAPPLETTAFYYYGGLPGLGSLSPDNQEGITAAVRILSATSPQEAQALVVHRGVTHLVIPSWDSYLNEYVRVGTAQADNTFLGGLRDWALPPWLRPVPYQMPAVTGYAGQSVAVFEVVEEQTEAVTLSRLAVYFVEVGRMDYATAVERELQRFPADLGAVSARAEVQLARGDEAALADSLQVLAPKLAAGADRTLSWERRVGLAYVLTRAKQADLARDQTRRCFAEVNEARIRSLSSGALYRLLTLGKLHGAAIADPAVRAVALGLMPAEYRDRL